MSWFCDLEPYCSALPTARIIEIAAVEGLRLITYQAPVSLDFFMQLLTLSDSSGWFE
jgi:hypothetical protein